MRGDCIAPIYGVANNRKVNLRKQFRNFPELLSKLQEQKKILPACIFLVDFVL